MGDEKEGVEGSAELICPYYDTPIMQVEAVPREFVKRGLFGIRYQVIAIASPACRRLLGFHIA